MKTPVQERLSSINLKGFAKDLFPIDCLPILLALLVPWFHLFLNDGEFFKTFGHLTLNLGNYELRY